MYYRLASLGQTENVDPLDFRPVRHAARELRQRTLYVDAARAARCGAVLEARRAVRGGGPFVGRLVR
jgi:hypothetical protein